MVPVNGDFCFESGAKVSKNVVEYQKVNYANKKESCYTFVVVRTSLLTS